jgi:hypothetical protein
MRIATWNLERGAKTRAARAAQTAVLRELRADVVVLTEPGVGYQAGPGVVTSPPVRPRAQGPEPWIAIFGEGIEPVLDVPYARLAAGARVAVGGRNLIIYGSVLPWLSVTSHAPEVVHAGEDSFGAFQRVLGEQLADIAELRRRHGLPVVWAGDFNQSLAGPLAGGSQVRRQALRDALDAAKIDVWNGEAAHAQRGLCAVDLV